MTSPEGRAWIWTVLYTAALLATVPYIRPVANAIRGTLGGPAFYLVAGLCYVGLGLGLLGAIFRRPASRPRMTACLALALVMLSLAVALALIDSPEERIHFIEYGLLGGLAVRAFAHRLRGVALYAATSLFGLAIGTLDELYQGILPDRFYDVRDIMMNAAGSILGWVTLRFILRAP